MKDRKINYRLLLKLVLPLGLLLCFATYQLAFKKTLESYKTYVALEQVEGTDGNLSISPAYSSARETAVNSLYRRYLVDTVTWKNALWNNCAELSQKFDCAVQGFPSWTNVQYGETVCLKQEIVFVGNFHNLIRLQYALDTIKNIGVIGGLSYSRNQRDLQTALKLQLLGLPFQKD